jgi:GAF domain-containing protein
LQPTPEELFGEFGGLATDAAGLLEPPELTGVCDALVATARQVFGAVACSVAVVDEDTDELVYIASDGPGAAQIVGTRLPVGRGLGGWVAQSGQPVAVADLHADPRFARDVAESTSYVPTALMAVPIESGNEVIGVLTLLDRDAARPGAERDMELASAFAALAAAGISATAAFRDIGSVLLRALAGSAAESAELRAVLAAGSSRTGVPGTARYVALLAELRSAGPAEQQLAVRLLEDVLEYARRKGASSRPR